jgi:hypothetical protein
LRAHDLRDYLILAALGGDSRGIPR